MASFVSFSPEVLGRIMPMHLCLDAEGTIRQTGPTLAKICAVGEAGLIGRHYLDLFELRRPTYVTDRAGMIEGSGLPVHLVLRAPPHTMLRGVWCQTGEGGALINLSFGIGLVDSVTEHDLSLGDFAATDLAAEMLYLVEANTAVAEELRSLTGRLDIARSVAEERADTDMLTGLKNRRAMDQRLSRFIAKATPFALMHVDLDYFKAVNDTYGHAAGDFVLQQVAHILTETFREQDMIVRVGGDEFVVILERLTDHGKLRTVAERLIDRLEQPIPFDGQLCRISASIGTTVSTRYAQPDLEAMQADADRALYSSKRAGRACVTISGQAADSTPGTDLSRLN